MLISSSQSLNEIIAAGDAPVFFFRLGSISAGHSLDELVKIGIAKIRNTVSSREDFDRLFMRRLDHAVDGALDGVVAPAGQQVTGVDHNGVWDGSGVNKLARG